MDLGQLTSVDAREVWTHEARDFTPWLAANLSHLAEALGVDLELVGIEVPIGPFFVDIHAREAASRRDVIIENQLAPTDHTHAGQLITYAAGLGATIVIWVAPDFRDEHRQAIDWLNTWTREGIDFFGVEVELLRVDDSRPAPHFKVVAQPNEWAKAVRHFAAAETALGAARREFFGAVLADFKQRLPGATSASRVGTDNWFGFGAGRSGFAFNWSFPSDGRLRAELSIETPDFEANKLFFDQIYAREAEIQTRLGIPLEWDRGDLRKSSRIRATAPEMADEGLPMWAVETMVKMVNLFKPVIQSLPRLRDLLAADPGQARLRLPSRPLGGAFVEPAEPCQGQWSLNSAYAEWWCWTADMGEVVDRVLDVPLVRMLEEASSVSTREECERRFPELLWYGEGEEGEPGDCRAHQ